MRLRRPLLFGLTITIAGCDGSAGGAACGFASVAGSTVLLNQFTVPNQTLGGPPRTLPEKLVVRMVAGPAYRALSGKTGDKWVIGMEGELPPKVHPGFGVLIVDQSGKARGVVLYESEVVKGAPVIGTVTIGSASVVPLIGIQLDPATFEDPRCPFFPDSILR